MKQIVAARPGEFVVVGLDQGLKYPEDTHEGLHRCYVSDKLRTYHRTMDGHVDNLRFLAVEEWWEELADGEKDLVGVWPSECDTGVSSPEGWWVTVLMPGLADPRRGGLGQSSSR